MIHRAFQRVNGLLPFELITERGQEPAGGWKHPLAGVHEHEAAGAVGVFRLSGLEAGLPDSAACWFPRMPPMGTPANTPFASPERPEEGLISGRQALVHRERSSRVPAERRDVHHLRAACVRHIGDAQPSVLALVMPQTSHELIVPNICLAGFSLGARAGDIFEQPAQLERREIGRERKARLAAKPVLPAIPAEFRYEGVGPGILPDDRVGERLAVRLSQRASSRADW